MPRYRICLACLILAFGTLTAQFAQEASKPTEAPGQDSPLHLLMLGFTRTMITSEVQYYAQHRSYVSWQALVANQDAHQYLNDWLLRFYPQFYPQASKVSFGSAPGVLPGLNLRVNVAPDGQSFIVLVEDATDKTGFAFVSDERGVIRYCQFIR